MKSLRYGICFTLLLVAGFTAMKSSARPAKAALNAPGTCFASQGESNNNSYGCPSPAKTITSIFNWTDGSQSSQQLSAGGQCCSHAAKCPLIPDLSFCTNHPQIAFFPTFHNATWTDQGVEGCPSTCTKTVATRRLFNVTCTERTVGTCTALGETCPRKEASGPVEENPDQHIATHYCCSEGSRISPEKLAAMLEDEEDPCPEPTPTPDDRCDQCDSDDYCGKCNPFVFCNVQTGICGLTCPIVIDVAGNGFNLTDKANGVVYDFSGDGTAEYIAWTAKGSDDAWLVLDRSRNGKIDNGSEFFGNFTDQPKPPVKHGEQGFLALAEFDKSSNGGNEDGQIDNKDSVFRSLRLWQDKNHDGVSGTDEMRPLSDFGIAILDLKYEASKVVDQYGNRFQYRARIKDAKGKQLRGQTDAWAWDVFLLSGKQK